MTTNELCDVLWVLGQLALKDFVDQVGAACKKGERFGGFTPHDPSHFSGVERAMDYLLKHKKPTTSDSEPEAARFARVEDLILRFCCWGHNVGMLKEVSDEYYSKSQAKHEGKEWTPAWARSVHDEASAYFIVERLEKIANGFASDYSVSDLAGKSDLEKKKAEEQRQTNIRSLSDSLQDRDENLRSKVIQYLGAKENGNAVFAHLMGLAYTVTLVASFHRRRKNLDACPDSRDVLGVRARTRMLAAIFRLADALHVDRTRFASAEFDSLRYQQDFSPESRRHWMKSYLVSSISIVEESHAVDVQLDIPESIPLTPQGERWGRRGKPNPSEKRREIVAGMRDFIVNDLEEDVLSVSGILLEYSFPPLLRVRSRVHSVPAMAFEEEIWSVLEEMNAAASPNTSQLINAALPRLHDTYGGNDKDQIKSMKQSLKFRLDSVKDMLEQRPCHEGLRKIRYLLAAIQKVFTDVNLHALAVGPLKGTGCISEDNLLKVCVEGVQRTFRDQRETCRKVINSGVFDNYLKDVQYVILYGYSDQVIDLLRHLVEKREQKREQPLSKVYILECRTKTLHTATGRLIYHDGARYATSLRDELGDELGIELVPDSAVGRILEHIKLSQHITPRKTTLVLFGSNAITLDGAHVHSMGHISVAAAAKCPRYEEHTGVYILTDGLKIGGSSKEVRTHDQRQRHQEEWLTTDATTQSSLNASGVETMNWMEDLVPSDLIDQIFVLDCQKVIEPRSMEIKEFRFDALKVFCEKFHRRIVAHNARAEFDRQSPSHQESLLSALEPQLGDCKKGTDGVCWSIAGKALDGEFSPEGLNDEIKKAWEAIWKASRKATTREANEAVGKFIVELSRAHHDDEHMASTAAATSGA